jgi:hypothetical protein
LCECNEMSSGKNCECHTHTACSGNSNNTYCCESGEWQCETGWCLCNGECTTQAVDGVCNCPCAECNNGNCINGNCICEAGWCCDDCSVPLDTNTESTECTCECNDGGCQLSDYPSYDGGIIDDSGGTLDVVHD